MERICTAEKRRNVCAVLLNLFVFVSTLVCVLSFFNFGGDGNMEGRGFVAFRYFTVDSNVLAAISSAVCLVFNIRRLKGKEPAPVWARILSLAGTSAVSLTLLTVLLFLGPFVYGYPPMFVGVNLFLHLLNPLAAIALFVFFENTGRTRISGFAFGVLPTFVYGAVYVVCAAVIGVWPDFYAFNRGGFMWLSAIIMLAFSAGIALALIAVANIFAKRFSRSNS